MVTSNFHNSSLCLEINKMRGHSNAAYIWTLISAFPPKPEFSESIKHVSYREIIFSFNIITLSKIYLIILTRTLQMFALEYNPIDLVKCLV